MVKQLRPSISEIAASRTVATLKRDDVIVDVPATLEPPPEPVIDVATLERDDVITRESAKKAGKLLHDSVYLHPTVRKALRQHALNEGVRLQFVLRLAVKEYLDRHGFHFADLETGKKIRNVKTS